MGDRTILQALKDELLYPVSEGFLMNKLIKRGLGGDDLFTAEIAQSKEFRGCVADCLIRIITAPNITEGGMSISNSDKDAMLKIANTIYGDIGESEYTDSRPVAYFGG